MPLNAIQPVQQRVEDAANLVKQVANGEVGQLRLGFTGTSMLNPLIPKCVRYFQQQYPKVNLKLEEANTLLLIDLLLEDRLDVAIIRSPRNMPDSLILQELLAEPLIAALPSESFQLDDASHEIDLTALRELDFIVSPPSVSAGLFDAIKQACHERGFEPKNWTKRPANCVNFIVGVCKLRGVFGSRVDQTIANTRCGLSVFESTCPYGGFRACL